MATLLGVGEVILDQARSPAVSGGGDVVIASSTGDLPSARWILSSALRRGGLARARGGSLPSRRATLYLVSHRSRPDGSAGFACLIRAHGGIPTLERAIGDPERLRSRHGPMPLSDAPWSSPDPGAALAALDRFHPIPDVPAARRIVGRMALFQRPAGDNRFYLTFLVGPKRAGGKRIAGVRLQLDRGGSVHRIRSRRK